MGGATDIHKDGPHAPDVVFVPIRLHDNLIHGCRQGVAGYIGLGVVQNIKGAFNGIGGGSEFQSSGANGDVNVIFDNAGHQNTALVCPRLDGVTVYLFFINPECRSLRDFGWSVVVAVKIAIAGDNAVIQQTRPHSVKD